LKSGSAKRAAIVGLDAARPDLIKRWADEGKLPHIAKLMREGAFMDAIPSLPHTAPGWFTIATGAHVGTHGIAQGMRLPGQPLDRSMKMPRNVGLCQAEFLWDAAARVGKRTILLTYPIGSPQPGKVPPIKNGIDVANLDSGRGEDDPPVPEGRRRGREGGRARRRRAEEGDVGRWAGGVWADPPGVAQELERAVGKPRANDPVWVGDAAAHLLSHHEWNLFMMHWHGIDAAQHRCLGPTYPSAPGYDPKRAEECWDLILKTYQAGDEIVGKVSAQAGDDAVIAIVSDHGNTLVHTNVLLNNALAVEGLLATTPEGAVDWSRTKAYATGQWHIYVNLRGREPTGIVEPGEDYEEVRDRLIKVLYDLRSPGGECPISLALRREDAAGLGLYGDRVGDVIYAARPGYAFNPSVTPDRKVYQAGRQGARHGMHLPTYRDVHAVFALSGPGVRRGYSRPRPCWLVDVAPTVAHLIGVPVPAQADGAILWDVLERQA